MKLGMSNFHVNSFLHVYKTSGNHKNGSPFLDELSFQSSNFGGWPFWNCLGVKLTAVAHLKALIALYWILDRPEAW